MTFTEGGSNLSGICSDCKTDCIKSEESTRRRCDRLVAVENIIGTRPVAQECGPSSRTREKMRSHTRTMISSRAISQMGLLETFDKGVTLARTGLFPHDNCPELFQSGAVPAAAHKNVTSFKARVESGRVAD